VSSIVEAAGLYPPEQYSVRWLILGVACVFAVLVGYTAVFVVTKERKASELSKESTSALAQLKTHYLELVDDLQHRYEGGSLPQRDAFLQLSSIMRRFVFEATGVKAHTATLAELRETAPASVSGTIADIYPAEFEPEPEGVSIGSSIATVREVVSTWS
jgi:hypothetical protein